MQGGGYKVYLDSYMVSNGSSFMVTWSMFQNHLFGVGPTQNQETMTTLNVHNHWFILFLSCVRTCMNKNQLN